MTAPRTRSALLFAIAALTLGCAPAPSAAPEEPDAPSGPATVVFLVRHAEAELPPYDENPRLRDIGQARAQALAAAIAGEAIDTIWSTDYHRTRETAAPAAARLGHEVELYDPRDLAGFAASLRAAGGRHLVVGHSNTTPALVSALGGAPGEPIDEAREFDRLYVVVIDAAGAVTTVQLRYGTLSERD